MRENRTYGSGRKEVGNRLLTVISLGYPLGLRHDVAQMIVMRGDAT